jgi:hypothetical protein
VIFNTNNPFPEDAGVSEPPAGMHDLAQNFPEVFFSLHDEYGDRHILIDALPVNRNSREAITEGFQGMACFGSFDAALDAACQLSQEGYPDFFPTPLTFEDARHLVLRKTCDIAALMLMDHPRQPLIHYVR